MSKNKPKGYWDNFDNLKKELEVVIAELGHFPTSTELRELGRSSLGYAIQNHGGFSALRKAMGHDFNRKPNGYWRDPDLVRSELEKITEELGEFPTQKQLFELGRSDLVKPITVYHGGLKKMRDEMGVPSATKSKGHWQDFNNVQEELEDVIKELGHFPTQKELATLNKSSLSFAIIKHHGGFLNVRERMGHDIIKKPQGYWENFDNIKKELQLLIDGLGRYPTQEEMSRIPGLLSGIRNYSGGRREVRRKMGHASMKRPENYWQDFENIKRELEPIIEELGHFPTSTELNSMKLSGLNSALARHHGGINEVAKKLGYEPNFHANGYWKDLDNVITELTVLTEKLGHFPTQQELRRLKMGGLSTAITKHGGFKKIQEAMGFDLKKRPNGYWENFGMVEERLERAIEELGHFPTQSELETLREKGLINGIKKYHGGILNVKNKMGYGNTIPEELEEEFVLNVESDQQALGVLRHFSDNPNDAADLLRALNPEKFKSNTYRILSLGQYLGKFKRGNGGIPSTFDDLLVGLEDLIEREEIVRNIIFNRAFQLYEQKYLQDPNATLTELKFKTQDYEGDIGNLYQKLYSEFRDLDDYEIPGSKESLE